MRGSEALDALRARLEHDISLRFPRAQVVCVDGLIGLEFPDGWMAMGTWVDDEDELSDAEVERWLAASVQELVDNGWPDEEIWPRCSAHPDHPLQVGIVRGAACWYCSRDQSVAYRVGALPSSLGE